MTEAVHSVVFQDAVLEGLAREQAARRRVALEFTGEGFEFFRIWIVNLLLTIVTLGIYSAWAKVRTQRYFYGSTRLDGASFDYLASPLSILKGRLVAFAMLLVYVLASEFVPLLGAVLMLFFIAIMPWVIVRGLAFRNHYSAWRGLRFGFDGRVGEAYVVFLLWPLLSVLTLGLLFPYAFFRQQRFIIDNTRYGVTHFSCAAGAGKFYTLFLIVLGVFLAGAIVAEVLGTVFPPLSILLMVAMYLLAMALFAVRLTNLRFNNTTIDRHATAADYRLGSYAALMFTNTLAIVLTLGLFYPWAKVRSARYAAAHIALDADGDLDRFVADQGAALSAVGGEIGDVFDVDLGF
ncbi:YjgN family protein [Thauera sp.]